METINDADLADTTGLLRGQLPDMAMDILGALLLCGFTHTVEAYKREDVLVTRISGYSVKEDGEQATQHSIDVVYEHADGEWSYVADQSGTVLAKKDGTMVLTTRTEEQVADYISSRINLWDVDTAAMPGLNDKASTVTESEDTVEDGVEEDVDEGDDDGAFDVPVIGGDDDGDWSDYDAAEQAKADAAKVAEDTAGQLALPAPAKPKRGRKSKK